MRHNSMNAGLTSTIDDSVQPLKWEMKKTTDTRLAVFVCLCARSAVHILVCFSLWPRLDVQKPKPAKTLVIKILIHFHN